MKELNTFSANEKGLFCQDIEVVSTIDYAQQFVEEDDDDGVS